MSLGDVMPALQQGAIDGALAAVAPFTPLHFYDAAKYMTETGQYYVFLIVEMNKKWFGHRHGTAAARTSALRPLTGGRRGALISFCG